MTALLAEGLGKRFGRRRALDGCSFGLPEGRIAALVGPNGSGKTTLMKLAAGLLAPTAGHITALGVRPDRHGTPPDLSFLAQDKPLYRTFRVAEMLRAGAALNAGGRWDGAYVARFRADAGLGHDEKVGSLSGGQRSRLALALALGRRPALLLVDEPLADLDPLARRQVMATLLTEVADTGMTVLMSTHILTDLDGVCDHLILLRDGGVGLAGDVDTLLGEHHRVTGVADTPLDGEVVSSRRAGRQLTAVVRGAVVAGPGLQVERATLEELVLAHLEPDGVQLASAGGGVTR